MKYNYHTAQYLKNNFKNLRTKKTTKKNQCDQFDNLRLTKITARQQ